MRQRVRSKWAKAELAKLLRLPEDEARRRGRNLRRLLGPDAPRSVLSGHSSVSARLRRHFESAALADWTECEVEGVAVPIYVRLGEAPDGEIVCTGLVIGVEPAGGIVRAQDLRIPLAGVVSELAGFRKRTGIGAEPAALTHPRARPGRRGRGADFYREVAARYRAAMKRDPAAPTKALFSDPEYQTVKRSTVRYWLREARRRGLLGKAEQGRPGEGAERKVRRGKARKL